eukprot:evm.model.NODE_27186_length_3404_cov_42.768803.1
MSKVSLLHKAQQELQATGEYRRKGAREGWKKGGRGAVLGLSRDSKAVSVAIC